QVIFTGSATAAAALAVAQKDRHGGVFAALPTEHDCLNVWSELDLPALHRADGTVGSLDMLNGQAALVAVSAANSETGIMMSDGCVVASDGDRTVVCDITQMAGKMPVLYPEGRKPAYMILSAHKIGGPKGVGAFINFTRDEPQAILKPGGQEMERRSGTENGIGISGF
ncbi:unnamed protein product, partial [Chrysoparadoxa australica]